MGRCASKTLAPTATVGDGAVGNSACVTDAPMCKRFDASGDVTVARWLARTFPLGRAGFVSDLGFLSRTNGSHSSLGPLNTVFRKELVKFRT